MLKSSAHDSLYWLPTPGGAYYAVSSTEETPPRRFLCQLLSQAETPKLDQEIVMQWCDTKDGEQALALLRRIRSMRWLQALERPVQVLDRPLEDILPSLLATLSDGGKVLLADPQGFYIASSGFPHETAEELAALSADLMSLQQRHKGLLLNNLNLGSRAWGIIDAGGHSRLGVWPMYIGRHCFALVLTGIPHFNHPDFVQLVWTLMTRYAPASVPL